MRYKNALNYLEKYWPRTASWVEETVGPRDGEFPQVNADLGVPGVGDRLFLVQCGLLIWIASGRPLGQPQNNWPGKILADIQKMFLNMNDEDLKSYLGANEKLCVPVVQPPPIPSRQVLPTGRSPQLTQPPQLPSRQVLPTGRTPQLTQPPQIPLRQVLPTGRTPQLPQPPQIPPRQGLPTSNLAQPTGQASTIPMPSPLVVRPRRLSKGPTVTGGTNQAALMKWIEEMQDLKTIFVCDIPTGAFRVYLTERSTGALVDNSKINIADTSAPEGWLKLGRGVLTNRMGKCWSCAAAVIYKLVKDPRFDSVRIESIGAEGYDHHFVVINRDSSTNVTEMSTWNSDAILIDAWQANLDNWTGLRPDQPKAANLCYGKTSDFPYKSQIRFFCAFEPADRSQHRESAGEVGKSVQGQTISGSWQKLKTCYVNHFGMNKKNPSCEVSGFCDKK